MSCRESPPLPPARVEHLKQVLAVCEGAGGEHPPEAQYTVEGGARLGERTLQDWLPGLLLVVSQGSRNRILQWTLVQSAVQSLQHLLVNQAETHSIEHFEIVLDK